MRPGRTAQNSIAFVWSSPDQWLAIGASADNLIQRLTSCAGASGSVTDLTGSRTIVRIGDPRARDGLMKVVPIDLDETVLPHRQRGRDGRSAHDRAALED